MPDSPPVGKPDLPLCDQWLAIALDLEPRQFYRRFPKAMPATPRAVDRKVQLLPTARGAGVRRTVVATPVGYAATPTIALYAGKLARFKLPTAIIVLPEL